MHGLWLSTQRGRVEHIGLLPGLYLSRNYRDSCDVTQGGDLRSPA